MEIISYRISFYETTIMFPHREIFWWIDLKVFEWKKYEGLNEILETWGIFLKDILQKDEVSLY